LQPSEITYSTDVTNIDWAALKTTLRADNFDNGRSVAQYEQSFRNSYAVCFAYAADQVVGTVRVLSDGVCNAYMVDVWTFTPYRRQGVARYMIEIVLEKLQGQHVYLWTDDMMAVYERLGFQRDESVGFSKVIGQWLVNNLK
jgi:ribosomal protein S18 acetylase RimI-like enzyme